MTVKKTGNIYPNIFRFNLGNFEITTILDGLVQRDGPYQFLVKIKTRKMFINYVSKTFCPKRNLNMASR